MDGKMTYEAFRKELITLLCKEYSLPEEMIRYLPRGYTSDDPWEHEVIRNTNYLHAGEEDDVLKVDILIVEHKKVGQEKHSWFNRIFLERVYQDYLESSFEEAVKAVIVGQEERMNNASAMFDDSLEIRATGDYEKIKDHLIIRPLNYKLHIRDLQGCVYQRFSDMAFVLYQRIGESSHHLTTSKIRRKELEKWGMQEQEEKIMEDALINTMRFSRPCVYDTSKQQEVDVLEEDFVFENITIMHENVLMSTFSPTNGAISLFYPGVREKMMKVLGGPFNAVFMNVNDVMLFKIGNPLASNYLSQAKELDKMGEMLSTKMYLCDENGINPVAQFRFKPGRRG